MKKTLLLLSGGFDSAVAGWMMQKKGFQILAVHFSFEPLTDNSPEVKSRKIAEHLGIKKFFAVNISKEIKDIADKCNRKYYFVMMKRIMFRKAEEIAKKEGCQSLLTGENLGQVSSQTLENLLAIDSSVKIPVLRPLIAMDKSEIIKLAEKIGTFEMSKGKEMCDVLGPEHPSTQARLETVLEEEKKLKACGQ